MRAGRIVEIAQSMQEGNEHTYFEQLIATKLMDILANPKDPTFDRVKRAVDNNTLVYVIHQIENEGPEPLFWVTGKGFVRDDLELYGVEDLMQTWLPLDGEWMPTGDSIEMVAKLPDQEEA